MDESGYSLDLTTFPLEKLQAYLKITNLLPSQKILKEEIDAALFLLETTRD